MNGGGGVVMTKWNGPHDSNVKKDMRALRPVDSTFTPGFE